MTNSSSSSRSHAASLQDRIGYRFEDAALLETWPIRPASAATAADEISHAALVDLILPMWQIDHPFLISGDDPAEDEIVQPLLDAVASERVTRPSSRP